MKWPIILVCVLIIGIGIGYWLGTHQPKKPQHIAQVFSPVGDLLLAPNPGDVLDWKNATVKFKNPQQTPCAEANPSSQCTIKSGLNGVYFYDCDSLGCTDPAIGMGSDTNENFLKGGISGILPPPYADPKGPKVQCDPTTKKATADDLKASKGDSFHYYPNGSVAFTITFAPGTCMQGDTLTNAHSDCTLTQGATIPQPAYTIQITGGGCQDGTGKLNAR